MVLKRRRRKFKRMSQIKRFDLAHAGGCADLEGVDVAKTLARSPTYIIKFNDRKFLVQLMVLMKNQSLQ